MEQKKTTSGAAVPLLVLFGLAFLAGGLFAGIVPMVKTLYGWSLARDWVQVPARVLATDLLVNRGKSTTYRVAARYEYDYRGQRYVGDRIGLDSAGSDNLGSWHQDMHARLRAAHSEGRFSVWVDPERPERSLIEREIRWELFIFRVPFALLFTSIGVGLLVGAVYVRNKSGETPIGAWWQREPDWRNGRVMSKGRFALWGAWFFAVFSNGLILPFLFIAWERIRQDPVVAGVLALLFLVSMVLMWRALRITAEWLRFKELVLTLTPFPAAAGAALTATLDLPTLPNHAGQFSARLTCRRIQRVGKDTRETAIWQQEVQARTERVGRGVRLAMAFTPPAGLPASSEPSADYHVWSIEVSGDIPGIDLDRRFDVPLTAAAAPGDAAPVTPTVPAAPSVNEADLVGTGFGIERGAFGTRLHYPPARHRIAGIAFLIFGAVFAGASAFMISQLLSGTFMLIMLGFMAGLFMLVAVGLLLGGLALLGYRLCVTVGPTEVIVARRFAGVPFTRRVPRADIARIDVVIAGSQKRWDSIENWYGLKARLRDRGSIGIGDGIRKGAVADALAAATAAACGLTSAQIGGAVQARLEAPLALGDAATRDRLKRWSVLFGRIVGLVFLASVAYEIRGLL